MSKKWTFEQAENYINDIPRFTKKNTMEDTKRFLHRLGDPDMSFPIIHVAGTNGKGSVCSYMKSILRTAGKRVALFTSPHLVDIRERFVVDEQMISREDFVRIFEMVLEQTDETYHPSYFEYLFFMAMIYFREQKPDYCILETGLGGRLDATNSVSRKALTVITHISLDHVEYLGDTVELIAGEKAGILKAGTPAVYWDTCPETTAVFDKVIQDKHIFGNRVSKNDYRFFAFQNKSIDFSIHTRYYGYVSFQLRTTAFYQMENATLAVRAIEELTRGREIGAEQLQRGICNAFWAGRMEEVADDVYVDGAHNEDGVRAFLESVRQQPAIAGRTLLFAVVKEKDSVSMVREILESGLFQKIAITHMHTGRAMDTAELEALFDNFGDTQVAVYRDVSEAFDSLVQSRQPGEQIYAAGSLYLVGEIKEFLQNDQF